MSILELKFPEPSIDLKDAFGDLAGSFKSRVRDGVSAFTKLLNGVGSSLRELLEPLIQELFENFKSLLKDITAAANELLNKSKALAEDLLRQAFERLSKLVTQVEQSVARLLEQAGDVVAELIVKVRKELLEPFVAAANEFRKNLISDLKGLINQAVEKVVDEVNKVLYKADVLVTGTLASITNELLKVYIDLEEFDLGIVFDPAEKREFKRHKSCKDEHNIAGTELRLLGNGKLYDYLECKDIKRLYEDFERLKGDVKVRSIKTTYSDLQERAWQLACLGRNSGLQDKALQGFVKYGQLFQLWNQFEDDMTAFSVMEQQIKALDSRIKTLDEKIATFQEKSTQLDNLSESVQAVTSTANAAQTTATSAKSEAEKAQSTADEAHRKADAAQITANASVKDVKFFVVNVGKDTTIQDNTINLQFPERVDAVALESIVNDGEQMVRARIQRRLADNIFEVFIGGKNGNNHRWIPQLRFLGIQIQR